MPGASSGSQTQPFAPGSMISAAPQRELTIAGRPIASASSAVLGKGS